MPPNMNHELTEDEQRVLVYLYACEEAGKKPNINQIDMPFERIEAAVLGLVAAGMLEPA